MPNFRWKGRISNGKRITRKKEEAKHQKCPKMELNDSIKRRRDFKENGKQLTFAFQEGIRLY